MDAESERGALVRVSDAEREAIVERLNAATTEGRLTLEEFTDRVSEALAARTRGDLDRLVVDLPISGVAAPSPARRGEVTPARKASQIIPIGSLKKRGRWRIDRDMEVGTVVGSVKLDMRQAEITAAEVELKVSAVLGSVKVWIPHGVAVEVDGQSLLGSRTIDEEAPPPHAPVLRLRVDTVIGSVKVYRV